MGAISLCFHTEAGSRRMDVKSVDFVCDTEYIHCKSCKNRTFLRFHVFFPF